MREIHTLHLSLLSFLVFLVLVSPVVAYPTELINISNYDYSDDTYATLLGAASINNLNFTGIYFREIGNYNKVKNINLQFEEAAVDTWAESGYYALNPNSSSETVYGYVGSDLVSVGILGYSRSLYYGGGTVYYSVSYWDPGELTGEVVINLSLKNDNGVTAWKDARDKIGPIYYWSVLWDTLETTALHTYGWDNGFTIKSGAVQYIVSGDETVPYTDSYFTTYSKYWANDIAITDYDGEFVTIDIYKYVNERPYWSKVMINQTINYQNVTIYNDKGRSNIANLGAFTSGPVYFMFWDGEGQYYSYTWPGLTPDYDLTVSKGLTSSNKLAIDEAATATLIGSLNGTSIRQVHWTWTEFADDSSDIMNWAHKDFVFNTTNASTATPWEIRYYTVNKQNQYSFDPAEFPEPSNIYNTVHLPVRFNWSDSSPWWINNVPPNNYVQVSLFDNENNLIFSTHKHVYVGTSLTNMTAEIHVLDAADSHYLSNVSLHVYDSSASAFILNKYIGQDKQIFEGPYNHQYVIWATHTNYTQSYTKQDNTIVSWGNEYNWTPWKYNDNQIYLYMNKLGYGGNISVMFHVQNENAVSIENAKVTFSSHQSSDVKYTDQYGGAYLWALYGLTYTYTVSKDGYQTQTGTFTTYEAVIKVITLKEGITEPTATITTVTPTPTATYEPGLGEEGFNLISVFIRLFQQAGAGSVNNAKLMLALVICSSLAFVFGYYLSFQASLIGAFVGFVFSIAFGLIPMWILIALIFIGGVFFVGKWWSGSSEG